MLVKPRSNFSKYYKYFLMFIFLILVFIFRVYVVNLFIGLNQRYFFKAENAPITLTEREELNSLRLENKVLADENKKIKDEFSVGDIPDKMSPVFMLLSESNFYGDFYVSLPKDKTPYKGMNIFSAGNIAVGQVSEILSSSLKISRLGQDKTFIANKLSSDESIELQSLGSGLYLGTVAGGSKISVGDTIVLKGYPKAIVGSVVEVTKSNTSLSQVFVRAPYNISSKEIFYVTQ